MCMLLSVVCESAYNVNVCDHVHVWVCVWISAHTLYALCMCVCSSSLFCDFPHRPSSF